MKNRKKAVISMYYDRYVVSAAIFNEIHYIEGFALSQGFVNYNDAISFIKEYDFQLVKLYSKEVA